MIWAGLSVWRSLLESGQALLDISDRSILRMDGSDTIDFFHRISTNDFRDFIPGSAKQTVILTEKGRVIDCLIVVHAKNYYLVITGNGAKEKDKEWLEKFIIAEDIQISETSDTMLFARFNIPSKQEPMWEKGELKSFQADYFGCMTRFYFLSKTNPLFLSDDSSEYKQIGQAAFERFRVSRGIPSYNHEMTREFNPFEINLKRQISFEKGCYIGQEVIARLDTYKKTQRFLCLVAIVGNISDNTPSRLLKDGMEVGILTSLAPRQGDAEPCLGLAVVKRDLAAENNNFAIENTSAHAVIEKTFQT